MQHEHTFIYKDGVVTIVYNYDDEGNFVDWYALRQGWNLSGLSQDDRRKIGFYEADMTTINEVAEAHLAAMNAE